MSCARTIAIRAWARETPFTMAIKDSIPHAGTRFPAAGHPPPRSGGPTLFAMAATRVSRSCGSFGRENQGREVLSPENASFTPWSPRGEIVALTGHLAENELHGELTFIERALAVDKARELYEEELGAPLSQRATPRSRP